MLFLRAQLLIRLRTRTCVTFDDGDYSPSYSSVTRGDMYSNSWKFSTLWKFSEHILYIFRTTRNFLSNSEILINVSNISVISAYVQITFTCHYILFTVFRIRNRNLHWGCPFVNKVGQYLINLVMQLFLKTCSGFYITKSFYKIY